MNDLSTYPELLEATRFISGRCDGARDEDGIGFSQADTHFGKALAVSDEWTANEAFVIWAILHKYRVQLSIGRIDYYSIPEPDAATIGGFGPTATDVKRAAKHRNREAINKSSRVIDIDTDLDEIQIRFDFDRAMVDAVKQLPGRKWNGADKYWYLPIENASELASFAVEYDFSVSEDAAEIITNAAPVVVPESEPKSIRLVGGKFVIGFPYDPSLIAAVKQISGRRWNNDEKNWTAPQASAEEVAQFAAAHNFDLDDAAHNVTETHAEDRAQSIEASTAEDADVEVEINGEFRAYQRAGIAYALDHPKTFIADDQGLGKTLQAIAVLEARNSFPAIVVVPASLKINWRKEFKQWVGRDALVLSGTTPTPIPSGTKIVIINYDILYPAGYLKKVRLGKPLPRTWVDELIELKPRALILDESHKCKTGKAARTTAIKKIADEVETVLCLTGTPILNKPAELISQLQILGMLDTFGGWMHFARHYCNAYRDRFGWHLDGATNLEELNETLRANCMIRRLKKDVLTELPPKQRSEIVVELDNRATYDAAEADVIRWFGARAADDTEFNESIAHLPGDERKRLKADRRNSAEAKASQAEQLVRFEALKRTAADGKLAAAIEWISDFIETGEKLVVFAIHRDIVDAIADKFNAPRISGGVSLEDRNEAVESFQNDNSVRLIVGNIDAMGTGLTLTASSNVAFIEQGWTPAVHAQAEDRTHRIGQTNQVTAWYILAENTIDQEIAELIEAKRVVVDAATNGGVADTSRSVASELVARMTSHATS